jgi:hypothetical protein
MDRDLLASEIGDEDFFEQAEAWRPDQATGTRASMDTVMARVNLNRMKPQRAEAELATPTSGAPDRRRPPASSSPATPKAKRGRGRPPKKRG